MSISRPTPMPMPMSIPMVVAGGHASPPPPRPPYPPAPVMRINQLDAEQLDQELQFSLSSQLRQIFRFLQPEWIYTYKPEFDLLLSALVFHFTTLRDRPTPGNKLQNLTLASCLPTAESIASTSPPSLLSSTSSAHPWLSSLFSTSSSSTTSRFPSLTSLHALTPVQKHLLFLFTVLLPYAHQRLDSAMVMGSWAIEPPRSWRRLVYHAVRRLELVTHALSLLNHLMFLIDGRHVHLIYRLLAIRLMYVQSNVARQVSYDFMNQQLAWSVLSDVTRTVVPLVAPAFVVLQRAVRYVVRPDVGDEQELEAQRRQKKKQREELQHQELSLSSSSSSSLSFACRLCERPHACLPHETNCGHVFCYYCVASRRAKEQNKWRCIECQRRVVWIRPVRVSSPLFSSSSAAAEAATADAVVR